MCEIENPERIKYICRLHHRAQFAFKRRSGVSTYRRRFKNQAHITEFRKTDFKHFVSYIIVVIMQQYNSFIFGLFKIYPFHLRRKNAIGLHDIYIYIYLYYIYRFITISIFIDISLYLYIYIYIYSYR